MCARLAEMSSTAAVARAAARASTDRPAECVVLSGEPGWDARRRAWNLAADQRPWAVALPETADDVRAIVELARARKFRIAPQATGHGALPLGSLRDTILLTTSRMRGVQIDRGSRSARVQAGELWGQVATAAASHGLAGLAGSSPTVGVVGYSLGGGIGWLARKYGLAANSILAAQVVTADGRLVRVDRDHEPDLFWAIRGGGSLAIVTELQIALYPVKEVYGGALFWPLARAGEVLSAWRAWTDGLPDEITSIARVRRMPTRPHIPERVRGQSFAIVEAACIGDEADANELLHPLRALGPEIDTFKPRPMTDLGALHLDPHEPMARIGDGYLLGDFPPPAVDAMLTSATPGARSPLGSVEVRHLGGALARSSSAHGALGSLDARFALYAVAMAGTPELAASVGHALDALRHALAPWIARTGYPNFADRGADPSDLYRAKTLDALRRIKKAYDPHELIRSSHPIAPQTTPERAKPAHNPQYQGERT